MTIKIGVPSKGRLRKNVLNVFKKTSILIDMVKHKLCIPVRELNIRPQQYYLFKNVGMLRVNDDDIYDTSKRGDVIINIELE